MKVETLKLKIGKLSKWVVFKLFLRYLKTAWNNKEIERNEKGVLLGTIRFVTIWVHDWIVWHFWRSSPAVDQSVISVHEECCWWYVPIAISSINWKLFSFFLYKMDSCYHPGIISTLYLAPWRWQWTNCTGCRTLLHVVPSIRRCF